MNDKRTVDDGLVSRLAFVVEEQDMACFFRLFQKGVKIKSRVGCSVEAFLRGELGAGPELIEKIQSIMLDGKPVDDINAAVVHDGSILAFSAAMPGLVGATLRRGGAYSSLRSAITYHETGQPCASGEGWVCVKLFNLLMAEFGPGLLEKGVLVDGADLSDFILERSQEFSQEYSTMLNGMPVDLKMLKSDPALAGMERVLLTVEANSPHLTSP